MSACIALDAEGGDHGVGVVVPAAIAALTRHPDLRLLLVGRPEVVNAALREQGHAPGPRLDVRHASQVVGMDEAPSAALRAKRDSSMRIAIDLVKSGEADACVSAGNTGALMAMGRFVLKTIPGIDRPAICSALPTRGPSPCRVLDLGANLDCTTAELFQFAVMGAVLAETSGGLARPKVALLNVGEEEMKGNDQVRGTAALLAASALDYVGYAEGHDLYEGRIDVVVCDGFVGNVALKSSEGAARLLGHFLREEFRRSLYTRLAALVARPVLEAFRRRADPRRYNGASLVGLRGIVVKSHGSADVYAFGRAIDEALREVAHAVPQRIAAQVEALLTARSAS